MKVLVSILLSLILAGCGPVIARDQFDNGNYEAARFTLTSRGYDGAEIARYMSKWCSSAQEGASTIPQAMSNLGRCYEECPGSWPCSKQQAIYWYNQAARYGNAPAQSNLIRLSQVVPDADLKDAYVAQQQLEAAQQKESTQRSTDAFVGIMMQNQINKAANRPVHCSSRADAFGNISTTCY